MRFGALIAVLGTVFLAACQASIGDSCDNSGDCSINAERVCDTTQPNGYCTIQGCDPDTCPGKSLCVEWRFVPGRVSERFCMDQCKRKGDCRSNYDCVGGLEALQTAEEVVEAVNDGATFARVIDIKQDKAGRTFCASKTEDCTNSRDDNANGLIDCEDVDLCCDEKACELDPACQ